MSILKFDTISFPLFVYAIREYILNGFVECRHGHEWSCSDCQISRSGKSFIGSTNESKLKCINTQNDKLEYISNKLFCNGQCTVILSRGVCNIPMTT